MVIQSIQGMSLMQSLTLLKKIKNNQIVLPYMTQSCMSTCIQLRTRQEDKEFSDTKYNKLSIITMSVIMFIFTDNYPQLKDAYLKATEKVEAACSEEDKCKKAESAKEANTTLLEALTTAEVVKTSHDWVTR